jgi:hypothetical protein
MYTTLLSPVGVIVTVVTGTVIKDEVVITIDCPIFPSILIAKYLFTGSLKNRSIDNLETQKKYISMKNSLIIYSMQNGNKLS